MKRAYLILAGTAALLLGLLIYAPAATVLGWLLPAPPVLPVTLKGVSGTLAHGEIAGLVHQNRTVVRRLRWQWAPLPLLTGRLAAHIQGESEDILFNARLALRPGGRLELREAQAAGSIKSLLAAAGQPFVPVDGRWGLQAAELDLADNWPVRASGRFSVENLAWTLSREPLALGRFEATIETQDERIVLSIRSPSGPLEAEGGATLLPERRYQLALRLRPRPEASPLVRNLLAGSGAPDAQGWYTLRQQGQVP
jgi:general secretion pathway protein N